GQDSLNSAVDSNLLERRTQDVLAIIENKSKVRNSRNKLIVSQVKSSDVNSSSSSKIAKLTHAINQQTNAVSTPMTAILKQFQATLRLAFIKAIEEFFVTYGGAHPYYQCLAADGNTFLEFRENIQGYISAVVVNDNQEKIKKINEVNIKAMQAQINNVKNKLRNEMQTSIQGLMSKQTNKLKDMMASFFQMNTASTSGSGPLLSNTIVNPKEDERAHETLTDPELADELKCKALADLGASINLMPLSVWKKLDLPELISTRITLELAYRGICTPVGIARDVFVHVRKFTFPADFVIVDYEIDPQVPLILGRAFLQTARAFNDVHREEMNLRNGASINLMPLSVWKKLDLPELISTRITLELAYRGICTPVGIARDVFVHVRKFTFPADFVIVDYEIDPQVPLILGRAFLQTARAFNDVHREEMNLRNGYLEDLFATNHLSGNLTFSSHTNHLLEAFADELALITFPPGNDDLLFDIKSDFREIEYFLNHDPTKEMDSILEDSVDEYDVDDDLVELEFDNDDVYDDPFDSKEDKIKDSKLLIDELDPPRSSDFLPSLEYDSVLYEDFFEVDALPSTNNEDKVFNQGILIHENLFEVTIRVTPELPFHKEVPRSETLLSFSFKNEEKVFKPRILTSKGVHASLLSELSHQGPKAFKVIKIFERPMEIFSCSYGEDIHILDVQCLHFYPPLTT
nr:reverse transcriptase domain-containing protein [Tanacetum cinerariifolium]